MGAYNMSQRWRTGTRQFRLTRAPHRKGLWAKARHKHTDLYVYGKRGLEGQTLTQRGTLTGMYGKASTAARFI